MWKVLFIACTACLFSNLFSTQATSYAYAASSDADASPCNTRTGCAQCAGQNEFYDTCISGCSNQTCDSIGEIYNCPIAPAVCRTGCRCRNGFYRNSDNVCVPESECPKKSCNGDPNATPGCGINCGRTCATYNSEPQFCIQVCKDNGCDCNKDFVFDDNQGRCVLPQDCTQCAGQNEFYDTCISGCSNQTCDSIGEIYNCPIAPAVCRTGCRCRKGFYRNSDNVCVPESECPQCGPNEIPSNCSNGGCGPFTCSDLGYPIKCVKPRRCERGCVCQNTYVRNENGTCVPKDQCTGPCGGDPNATPGCGVNCGRTCSTYRAKNPICPRICFPNACDCKPGYVMDPNVNRCVLPVDCTPTCGVNETYCPCCHRCVCQKGYSRPSRSTCVRN